LSDGNQYTYDDGSMMKIITGGSYIVMELSKNGEVYENVYVASDAEGLKESKEQIWVDPNNYRNSTQGGNPKGLDYVEEWHLWDTPFIVFPWGLKVGESRTITRNERIYIPDGNDGVVGGCATQNWTDWKYVQQESTVTVEKEETITVPAGTFRTLKVKYYLREKNNPFNFPCDQFSQGRTAYFWLASGVGIVQQQRGANISKLVSYIVK